MSNAVFRAHIATAHAAPTGLRRACFRILRMLLLSVVLLGGAACSLIGLEPETDVAAEEAAAEDAADPAATLHYVMTLRGVRDESELGQLLRDSSDLVRFQESPPASFAGLERRTETDLETFATVLRSKGYYGYTLSYEIDDSVDPVNVIVNVETGPKFKLESYRVLFTGDDPPPAELGSIDGLGIDIGMTAEAPAVAGAETLLLRRLADHGRPLATVEDREILVDHATRTMRATLTVDAGPASRFGPLRFNGLTDVEQAYLERLVPWQEGDPYSQLRVDEYRQRLSETDLFESILIEHAPQAGANGSLPMTTTLVESKHRTIGGSLSWSTDIGPAAAIFWEHRNAFGENENIRAELEVSPVLQELDFRFRRPAFRRVDQALLLQATATRENDEAFEEESLRFFGGVERELNDQWTVNGGGEIEFSAITDEINGDAQFVVFGLPLGARYDGTDDLLDPTEGSRLALTTTPTLVTYEHTAAYLATDAIASTYLAPFESDRVVFALRGRLGSIAGADEADVPANRRFYAGGGGSVRGYESRSIGPLDSDDDPLGGTSVWELGFETRIRVTESIGVVPFIDVGQVGRDPWPKFTDEPLFAAGLGFRYYTGFGPIRLDVAFPLNPRERDDAYQFYISLGQAF